MHPCRHREEPGPQAGQARRRSTLPSTHLQNEAALRSLAPQPIERPVRPVWRAGLLPRTAVTAGRQGSVWGVHNPLRLIGHWRQTEVKPAFASVTQIVVFWFLFWCSSPPGCDQRYGLESDTSDNGFRIAGPHRLNKAVDGLELGPGHLLALPKTGLGQTAATACVGPSAQLGSHFASSRNACSMAVLLGRMQPPALPCPALLDRTLPVPRLPLPSHRQRAYRGGSDFSAS